jgi:diaminohydroxyphosphoribosylaminopyrimidine deaminase/5-amino-6-(5-phosphoribosylamino)uracil reductase
VGSGTARADDPRLTARVPGGRDPLRVVLDTRLGLPHRLALFRPGGPPTLVAHAVARPGAAPRGAELLRCRRGPGGVDLRDLLERLAARGVTHLLVEGGARVSAAFLAAGLVDRLAVFVAPKLVGADGIPLLAAPGPARMADALALERVTVERVGEDVLVTGVPARGRPQPRLAKNRLRG